MVYLAAPSTIISLYYIKCQRESVFFDGSNESVSCQETENTICKLTHSYTHTNNISSIWQERIEWNSVFPIASCEFSSLCRSLSLLRSLFLAARVRECLCVWCYKIIEDILWKSIVNKKIKEIIYIYGEKKRNWKESIRNIKKYIVYYTSQSSKKRKKKVQRKQWNKKSKGYNCLSSLKRHIVVLIQQER